MADKVQVDVALTGAKEAAKGLDDVADSAEQVEGHDKIDLDVTSNVAKVLGQLDELSQEASSAAVAAEALGQALGPELSGRSDLPRLVAELDKLGVSADEVAANADQLAAKLREVDSEDLGGGLGASLGTAKGKTDDLADSARGANSALANMVGNATQDLGSLGGLAGSAGVAIGQMGEYAADAALGGEALGSALKSMIGVAGPIAAIAAATQLLSDVMGARTRSAEADAQAQKALNDAYTKGGDVAGNYADSLRDVGEVTATTGANTLAQTGKLGTFVAAMGQAGDAISDIGQHFGLFGQTVEDLTPLLSRAGVSVDTWSKAVVGGNQAFGDLAQGLTKTSLTAVEQRKVLDALGESQVKNTEAKRNAAAMETVFGESVDKSTKNVTELDKAYQSANVDAYANQQRDLADTLDRVNKILLDQADALNTQVDAATAAADSQVAANDAYIAFGAVLKDNKATAADVRDAAVNLAKANQQLARDQAAASGATETSTQNLDAQNKSLLSTAATAKGPARSAILDYVGSLNQIPPEKLTEIQAAINAGDLALAQRLLDEASAPRKAAMQADANTAAAHSELDNTANPGGRPRTAFIQAQATGFDAVAAAARRLFPGATVAGTAAGPPVATPTSIVNVTQNLPRGFRGDALTAAATAARRHGGLYQKFSR